MPGLQDYLAARGGDVSGSRYVLDIPYAPSAAPASTSKNTWVGGGINAGIREMRAMGGSALEGLGRATGWKGLEEWGADAAANNLQRAQEVGRPDLETPPWKEGGAPVAPWIVYQGAKMLPTLAGFIGGSAAGAAAAPALGVSAGIAGFGGAALSALPATAGQVYQSVKEGAQATGQEITPGQAGLALAAGIPSAAIGAVQLPVLRSILGREIAETAGRGVSAVAGRLAAAGVEGGLSQVPIAAAQRTIEMGFRPDLTIGQKAHEVVDAAITGGVLGGVFGAGAGGVREFSRRSPSTITNPDLKTTIDGQLGLPLEGGQGEAPPRPPLQQDITARPHEQLTDRQLDVKLENAQKGATLGLPTDVALMNQLLVERQLRQPELPLEGGYSDNLTAPVVGRYDLDRPAAVVEPPIFEPLLPLRGGDGQAPSMGDPEARPFRGKSFSALEQVIAAAQQTESVRPLTPEESSVRQIALGELQARERATPLPRQLDLGLKPLYAPEIENLSGYMGEPGPRPQPQGLTEIERLQQVAGKGTRLPRTVLDAPDLPAALDLIDQAASKKNAPRWALDAAEKFGLDGSIDEKLALAQKRLQDEQMGLEQWRGEGAPDPLPLQRAQSEVYELQQRKSAIEAMESRRVWQGEGRDGDWVGFSKLPEPTDTPVFSAATATEQNFTPIADAPLKSTLERMTKRLGASADRLRIVPTVADLPEKVRQAALDQGVPEDSIRGSYSDGVGWLVRDRIRNEADIQEVVAHEMFGHAGAKAAYGDTRLDRFSQLFDKAGGLEGVLRIARKLGAEAQLRDYIPEGSTALDKARFFDEMLAQAAGKTEGKLQQTALAWMGRIKQSMIGMLENLGLTALARRMDTFSELDTAVMLRNMRKAVQAGFEVPADHQTAFSRVNATVPEANNNMRETVEKGASRVLDAIKTGAADMLPPIRRTIEMLTMSPDALAAKYRNGFTVDANGHTPFDRINLTRMQQTGDRNIQNRMYQQPLDDFQKLPVKKQDLVSDVINRASMLNLTPGMPWDQHTDLHVRPNVGELRKALDEVNKQYATIRQDKEMGPTYDNLVLSGRSQLYSHMNAALRAIMKEHPLIPHKDMPSFQTDQMAPFRQTDTVHPMSEAAEFFKNSLDATRADAMAYVTQLKGQLDTLQGRDKSKLASQIEPLESFLLNMDRSLARAGTSPYAHLGRNGDYFVGAKIKTAADGSTVDPRSLQYLKNEAQRRGFDDVSIVLGNDNPNMFVRFETPTQAENFHKFMQEMQAQGHIQNENLVKGAGLDAQVQTHLSRMVPAFANRLLEQIGERSEYKVPAEATAEQRTQIEAARNEMMSHIREAFVDMMPSEAIGRFQARREGAQGFSANFARNQAKRLRAGVNAVTALEHGPTKAADMAEAYSDVRKAEADPTRNIDDLADMKAVYNEYLRRGSESAPVGGSRWADVARSATHSFLTAASPAYAMVQLTQLGVTGLPELGKRFGYMPSAKAMAAVTTPAFNILRVAMQEGAKKNGIHGVADMVITRDVLQKAGIPKDMQNFLIRSLNRDMEIGSQSRELGMLADANVPGWGRRTAQYANAMGFAAEAATRLIMAMSTYKLAKGRPDLDAVASSVMNNSMFNFGPSNTSRLLDPHTGPFGKATGLAAVFLRFQSMLIEKLYREVHTAIKGSTPEDKAASRKFLAGHLAAMTVLGGTMALPMVSVMARAADKMVDLTQEEGSAPFDVKTAWRDFLADVFGKDMGEVAARGLPRALGVDLSNRIGEQDIIPFSRFLTDRRKAEDTIEDLALRIGGAGVATGINIFDGLNDIFNHGDVLQGMTKILPSVLRNPAVAYRMGTMGYVDEKNAPLPIQDLGLRPSARTIAVQALGFTPSEVSEYREHRQAMLVRKTDLEANASLIRKHLATALEQGDTSGVQTAMQQMTNHDRLNPAYAVGPSLAAAMAARQRNPMMARMLGQPMGFNPRDIGGLGMGSSYNWRQ